MISDGLLAFIGHIVNSILVAENNNKKSRASRLTLQQQHEPHFTDHLTPSKDPAQRHRHVDGSCTKVSDLEALLDNLPGFWHL